jgi:hypothetical protein
MLAQQCNQHRDKGQPIRKPAEFNPFARKPAPRQATPDEIRRLLGPDWHQVET